MQKRVFKYVLQNGLTVLICPKKASSKVAMQMWYNVGSKHEQPGEKGMAHFLEHMVFKGTEKMLSESDINALSQKLAADANAFTSYDYTAYVFDVPVANWEKMLPIYADCMVNCSFLQDHMNSEVQAVIQELKMYKDDFHWTLADGLITNMFESHPYHFPIIGYKQDLWNLQRETFLKFYKKYYVPNNAAFVIVGDLDPQETFAKIEAAFGTIPRGKDVHHPEFFFNDELQSKSFTIYKDTEQSHCMMAFAIPAAREKKDFIFDIISTLMANGKGSRLHAKLIDELELVSSVSSMSYDLFDRGVFFVTFKPKRSQDTAKIKELIFQEFQDVVSSSLDPMQLRRALKMAQIDYQHLQEDVHKQASAIGRSFMATGDYEYPFTYCNYNPATIEQEIKDTLKRYFRSSLCYFGQVSKVADADVALLQELQEQSDNLDTAILSGKQRQTEVEPARYAHTVQAEKLPAVVTPQAQEFLLDNGLKVLLYYSDDIDLVECALRYKADYQYDQKMGIGNLVAKMMQEGTSKLPGLSFAQESESYGIGMFTNAGHIECSVLPVDIAKGLDLMSQMVQEAQFDDIAFERVKATTIEHIVQFWDTPKRCINQIAAEHVYDKHPYAYMSLGTEASLRSISRDEAYEFYRSMVTPKDAVLVIVGKFDKETIQATVRQYFAAWNGPVIDDLVYPALSSVTSTVVDVIKQRDQIVLVFAGLSVSRLDQDYDALLVFNQLLTVGMNSFLFSLREQSGLFYTIGGSLVHGSGKQPGMIFIKTIVSKDRVQEAQQAIASCLDSSVDLVEEQDFDEAKEMVINTFPNLFESYESMANTLMFLEKYDLPSDYFQTRIAKMRAMDLEHMKRVVKKYLHSTKLACIRVGRLD